MTSPSVTWPLRTERLLLRPYRDGDGDRLLEIRNRPEAWRWLMKTEVDGPAFVEGLRKSVTDPRDHTAVIELDGEVVGLCYLEVGDGLGQDAAQQTRGVEALLGYVIDPAYAGRGIAREAARAALDLAFGTLGARRVTAGCFADNIASWKVLESLGMRREQHGVEDSWHTELGWVDGYTYGMLAREWPATEATIRPASA